MIEMFDWIAKKPFEWFKIGNESEKNGEMIYYVDYFDDSNNFISN